jgi:hypothetical protein
VQIKEFESPSLLPRLEALDAEFGCEDEQYATRRRKQEGTPMDDTLRPTQAELSAQLRPAKPLNTMKRSSLDTATMRPSLGRRASRRLSRFLIVFCVGAGTTLAWQSYGDTARAMIANASPQLGWLTPQTVPVVATSPNVVAPASSASPDLQHLALGLAALRQSVDQLTSQLAAGQQQMGGDIAKLQADGQEILHKLSATSPRPTAAPAHKPAPVSASAPTPPSQQAR